MQPAAARRAEDKTRPPVRAAASDGAMSDVSRSRARPVDELRLPEHVVELESGSRDRDVAAEEPGEDESDAASPLPSTALMWVVPPGRLGAAHRVLRLHRLHDRERSRLRVLPSASSPTASKRPPGRRLRVRPQLAASVRQGGSGSRSITS